MSDLIQRAKIFATQTHRRIEHQHQPKHQPYEAHLKAVAELVSSSGSPEMVAAAWLHDIVDDTSATFHDLHEAFGSEVARLVSEVTPVSRSSDGSRERRRAIDHRHFRQASPEGQALILADLIDTCRDLCRHDPDHARLELPAMAHLVAALHDGPGALLKSAHKALEKGAKALGLDLHTEDSDAASVEDGASSSPPPLSALRRFIDVFSAKDIAEPLPSFDGVRPAREVGGEMLALGLEVAGLRELGAVRGFARRADLERAPEHVLCRAKASLFGRNQILDAAASLTEVVDVLTRHEHCFVRSLDTISGVIARDDMHKPVARMWLFGMITAIEMDFAGRIRKLWPDDAWTDKIAPGRLVKAREIQVERQRRGQRCDLLDCLQLSDKALVLISDSQQLAEIGGTTKAAAKRVIKELESLRNNLAHAQDIVTHDWPQIARMTRRVEELVHGRS